MIKHRRGPGFWRSLLLTLVLGVITSLAHITPTFASLYGRGTYNSCPYQQVCPQPPAPTVTTTSTGLQVAINLSNGQTVPVSGYGIVITPLNGRGTSFKQADIYISGVLTHTALPDETGTARWWWVPGSTGTKDIKIVIIDTNNSTTTQEFTIKVSSQPTATQTQTTTIPAPPQNNLGALLQRVGDGISKMIKTLPAPVVHSFPYFLFILLFIDLVLLLLQVAQELREYRAMKVLLEKARMVDEEKKTFSELAAHYLRTPLTVILGSIDLLDRNMTLPSSTMTDLKATAERMRDKIESLIAQIPEEQQTIVAPAKVAKQLWRQPRVFLPIALIALLWLIFDYLVARVGDFTLSEVELVAQAIAFTILTIVFYQIVRYRQLRRRDTAQLKAIIEHEQNIGDARDTLITTTVTTLRDELKRFDGLVPQLRSPAPTPLLQGRQRFHEVLAKFALATRLGGIQSKQPYVSSRISDLVSQAENSLQKKMNERGVSIRVLKDNTLSVQEPELLAFVLMTLLDNAIAYSTNKSIIEVDSATTAQNVSISITDQGSGIPSKKLALLFQPFSKIEGAETFTHEGMGFSLYLDKLIMAYMGGGIILDSQAGKGTTVILNLPQPQATS